MHPHGRTGGRFDAQISSGPLCFVRHSRTSMVFFRDAIRLAQAA